LATHTSTVEVCALMFCSVDFRSVRCHRAHRLGDAVTLERRPNKSVRSGVIYSASTECHLCTVHPVRRIRCTPLSVSTMPDSSPMRSPNAVSSNGRCITPRPKKPRSPPLCAEPQSENLRAIASNWDSSAMIALRNSMRRVIASAFQIMISGQRHDDGRLEFLCFTKM